ncbi:MAG: 3-isopropylmalate dehydratase [Gammaproteobacteria bacterium]|nr:3-isopropylmalate dehydratase [Gammaproteobacteria bacterium]
MSSTITGKVWVFGDDIDTDVLAPGLYMKGSLELLASHCLESVDSDFASSVAEGEIVIAGENFGIGSSREQAAQVLKHLGIKAIIAKSFGGIFFRNALNYGLVALTSDELGQIKPGDRVSIKAATGELIHIDENTQLNCDLLPPGLLNMVEAGGLVPHLQQILSQQAEKGK